MNKFLQAFTFFFLLTATTTFAQIEQTHCGTPILPLEYEAWLNDVTSSERNSTDPNVQTAFIIPTIVHVIYDGEAMGNGSNISQTQINSQFTVLNQDYNKTNTDFSSVCPAVFQGVAANCQISFCKALRNPSGVTLVQAGIDRVNRNTMGFSAPPYNSTYFDATIKPATIWDPTRYLNIWVANLSGGILGYSTFPANSALTGLFNNFGTASTDGVVILFNAFGNVGTLAPPYDKGRTATHEIGHWLGLRHIWGDTSCGNDFCNDTPTQQTANFAGCPPFPQITCNNGPNGDMWMNYMDYVTDACMVMFTANQKTRMQTAMAHGTYRVPLASSFVCSPLGIDNISDEEKFIVFPNPTSGKLTVDAFNMGKKCEMKIYDLVGEVVKEMTLENQMRVDIDLSDKPNGMYFITLTDGTNKVTKKFNLVK